MISDETRKLFEKYDQVIANCACARAELVEGDFDDATFWVAGAISVIFSLLKKLDSDSADGIVKGLARAYIGAIKQLAQSISKKETHQLTVVSDSFSDLKNIFTESAG